jgi:hypothetical protein
VNGVDREGHDTAANSSFVKAGRRILFQQIIFIRQQQVNETAEHQIPAFTKLSAVSSNTE